MALKGRLAHLPRPGLMLEHRCPLSWPACAGHHLVRINLSDQTDMMDLLGADLPAAGGTAGRFAWSDGPLLQAIRQGHWVLLDELNLAGHSWLQRCDLHLFLSEAALHSLGNSQSCDTMCLQQCPQQQQHTR